MRRGNALLLTAALVLAGASLLLPMTREGAEPFTGADAQAEAAIVAAHPDYRPWFQPLWTPPGQEIESLLFALQAALGAGLIGYYLGLKRGQSQRRPQNRPDEDD